MTVRCTATIHHGNYRATFEGFGANEDDAFHAAVDAQGVGYQPSRANDGSAHVLLSRHRLHGHRLAPSQLKEGNVTMTLDGEARPVIHIGWVTYTWDAVRLWAVTAQVSPLRDDGFSGSRQVPTFYLDPAVQGILSEQGAQDVARQVLTAANATGDVELHVHVEPVF